MRLYGNKTIPENFDLMEELVARIRSGGIDLSPIGTSGWYDYQTWALEPLVTPDKTPEAVHLKLEETYRKQLVEIPKPFCCGWVAHGPQYLGADLLAHEAHRAISHRKMNPAGSGWAAEAFRGTVDTPRWIAPVARLAPRAELRVHLAEQYCVRCAPGSVPPFQLCIAGKDMSIRRVGAIMHAGNPYGSQVDYGYYDRNIQTWLDRITGLLSSHTIKLVNNANLYLVHMQEQRDGKVHHYVFAPSPGPKPAT
jgi:hypothetical protein